MIIRIWTHKTSAAVPDLYLPIDRINKIQRFVKDEEVFYKLDYMMQGSSDGKLRNFTTTIWKWEQMPVETRAYAYIGNP